MADTPKNFSPAELAATIRECLISALSGAKAYDVPSLCRRFGLADGTEQEAFSSRYKYVSKRVRDVPGKRVIEIAREYLTEHDNFQLAEAVQISDENQEPPITELTRRRIMALLKTGFLVTEIEELEFFQKLWPIASIHCQTDPSDYQWRSFEDALIQHTMRNGDWDNVDVLKAVGFPAMSRHEVGRFLVALVDPMMQKAERQAQLVSGLNEHLTMGQKAQHIANRLAITWDDKEAVSAVFSTFFHSSPCWIGRGSFQNRLFWCLDRGA